MFVLILFNFLRDDLRTIIKQLQLHVLEEKEDRHFVTPGALPVDQLKDELNQRRLPTKGKKAILVARLTRAIGNGNKVNNNNSLLPKYSFN